MTIQCCVCHRVKTGAGWKKSAKRPAPPAKVSHGYCPACAEKAFAEIRAAHATSPRLTRAAV